MGTNLEFNGLVGPALLRAAGEALEHTGLKSLRRSSFWLSPAWPDPRDPSFVNACVLLPTAGWDATALMQRLHAIEAQFGRVRGAQNAPRTLDLDLIDFDGPSSGQAPPALPHPRMHARAFVLAPLAEIAPHWRHPTLDLTAAELLLQAPDRAATQRLSAWAETGV